jgi:DNA-binding transcriptional regulator YiaG
MELGNAIQQDTTSDNESAYAALVFQRAAARVRMWRTSHRMGQVEFARLAGVSVGCLQAFEGGVRDTRESNVAKIAAAMGQSFAELTKEDDPYPGADPLLNLRPEDLRIAHAFHHAGADVKHAAKRLFL